MKLKLGIVAIAVAVCGVIGFFALRPPNAYIHGIAVSGLSAEEAEVALMARFQEPMGSRVITYRMNENVVATSNFADFGARFDFATLVEDGLRRRFSMVFWHNVKITELPRFSFEAVRMEDVLQKLSQSLDIAVSNAAFAVDESGGITVKPEVAGVGVDTESAAIATRDILFSLQDGVVDLETITIVPMYTAAHFDFTPVELGRFATFCCEDDGARCRNIALAASRINGRTLYPDEVFSAGEAIGAHLPDSGYEAATIMLRGQPAEDIGGGVCQVVTTLYNAILRAEMEIIQRHNHSAKVSYVDVGFDATVAGNYYDLKFRNTTPYPILITARVENKNLEITIIGNETREATREIRFETKQIELIKPQPYREVIDPAIPSGERVVTTAAQMGYHIELYKLIYVGGEEVERIKINTSVYQPLQGVIAIGAG